MSRLARLKKLKRKNITKATACCLALSLAIGSVQWLGTYALFTDTENVPSNLAISTGDVDVAILDKSGNLSSDSKYIMLSYTDTSKTIRISNQGTLRQNIKIKVSFINGDVSKNIEYKLIDTNGNNIIDTDFRRLYENGPITVELSDTLNPGDEMRFQSNVHVDALIFGTREFDFKLEVIATQVGYTNNGGFSDSYTQTNKVLVNSLGKVLNETEKIELPKEEVEVPSESDIVVPNQTDIIAQKKEEDVE